jgi:hypothetical protein
MSAPFGFPSIRGGREKLAPEVIVKTVRSWRRNGYSYGRICSGLKTLGLRNRLGRPFSKSAVVRMVLGELHEAKR